jgi:hypothetical protein
MTARIAAALVSGSVALGLIGCTGLYEIPVETPIQAKIDVSNFQRVLVAGFVGGGSKTVDTNTETARLLRSQLRSKQNLRVIDADALSLTEEVDKRLGRLPTTAKPGDEPEIKDEKDLASYEAIFTDTAFWKNIGDQYQGPLIVTGSIVFNEISRSGVVSQPVSRIDQDGREQYQTVRTFSDLKGFAISPKFIFIDGRTGAQLHTESYNEESLYPTTQNTPALSSYFELMDKLLPSFLNTMSSQRIRGSRVLLK